MKQLLLQSLPILLIFTACQSQPSKPTASQLPDTEQHPGFAVVELFTSQGCSSCPPADALLGKEIAAYAKPGKKLIALSFHVDYWNRLGWMDPYSQHIFTERQYGYSAKMKLSGVYTPQAVVNGQWETVGSKEGTIESFIKQSLAETPESSITIEAIKPTGNILAISYQYKGSVADMNIAVVQKTIATPIKAGENGGRTLTNYNVVRSWKTVKAQSGSHIIDAEMPAGYNEKEYSVVVYTQEKEYGKVLAADVK